MDLLQTGFNMKKIGSILLLIMFIISIGCTANASSNINTNINNTPLILQIDTLESTARFDITVIHYDNYNVTCFVMDSKYDGAGGISCISDLYVKGV
jgi:hypothetical protein